MPHTELVFEPVQVSKICNMGIINAQGFLKRHCNDAVRGAIEWNVRTPSLLSSEPGPIFIPKNGRNLSQPPHQMSQCISENQSSLAFAPVRNRGAIHCIVTSPNWEGRRHHPGDLRGQDIVQIGSGLSHSCTRVTSLEDSHKQVSLSR